MKRSISFILFFAWAFFLAAQTPQAINYQAVARNASGAPISSASIGVKFSILEGSEVGNAVYSETHLATTNQLGLFTLSIGLGEPESGTFEDIDWGGSDYYLEVSIDPDGGTNYQALGTPSRFLSVPYALRTLCPSCTGIGDADLDTYIETEPSPNPNPGQDPDQIHMYLGGSAGSPGFSPWKALVLRRNNPAGNTMLEIFDFAGQNNLFIGENSGNNNLSGSAPTGTFNTAVGYNSLAGNNAGNNNTAFGAQALKDNTGGAYNTAIGSHALFKNKSQNPPSGPYGQENTAVGNQALYDNTYGSYNTASGVNALLKNVQGNFNTAMGHWSLSSNTGGNNNTAFGANALNANIAGTLNTAIGFSANVMSGNLNNASAIGANAMVTTSDAMILGHQVNVGIGLSGNPAGPGNRLEINAATPNASGLRFRQLTSASPGGTPSNPPTALSVDPQGDVVLVDLSSIIIGGNDWHLTGNFYNGGDFLGTINPLSNPAPLQFKVNNIHAGIIDPMGQVFFGFEAGSNNSWPTNTGLGYQALKANSTGKDNTATGYQSLLNNAGSGNTATGTRALLDNTTGGNNTAAGLEALTDNISGQANTAVGVWAMHQNDTGQYNTALGAFAMEFNQGGSSNTAVGVDALSQNVTGYNNTALGVGALEKSIGNYNTATGWYALQQNQSAANTAHGVSALQNNTTGDSNTGVGHNALISNITGSNNTALGAGADVGGPALHNATAIGAGATATANNQIRLGNNMVMEVLPGNDCIASLGFSGARWKEVWACNGLIQTSDSRLKTNISEIGYGLDEVLAIEPVQFFWKEFSEDKKQLGFIAQEIEGIIPEAVIAPKSEEEYYAMKYDALVPVLAKAIQEQQAQIDGLKEHNQSLQDQLGAMMTEVDSLKALIEKNTGLK